MKAHPLLWALMLMLAAGGAGYWLRGQRADEASVMAAWATPGLDYFTPPESFSRIENTKKSLEALCLRLRSEVERGLVADVVYASKTAVSGPAAAPHLEGAIRDLERGMNDP